jgi:hypothetical protein
MKKLILISLLFVLGACHTSIETHFNKYNVSVTGPKGWKVTEEDLEGEGYSVSIEKEGFSSSGLVTITWINVLVVEEEFIDLFIEEFKESIFIKIDENDFTPPYDSKYNNYNCKTVDYSFSLMGIKHQGKIHSFQTAKKTFIILLQEANEDHDKNLSGFRTIETSLKCS